MGQKIFAIIIFIISVSSNLFSQINFTSAEVVAEINRLRQDPSGYAASMETEAKRYRGVKEFKEAIKYLKSKNPIDTLITKYGLEQAAEDHATDCGKHNRASHTGSDGSDPLKRMLRYASVSSQAAENIAFGGMSARETVLMWVIDKGVKNRGHRKTLMNPNLKYVGVSIMPFKTYKTIIVADFCEAYQDYVR